MTKERIKIAYADLALTAFGVLTYFQKSRLISIISSTTSYPEKKCDQSKMYHHKTTHIQKSLMTRRIWSHQHRNKKIHSKALQFPTKRLLLGTRRRAL
jgi:hypothetical protein